MDRRTKQIVTVVVIFLALFILIAAWGFADDGVLDAWIMCQPGSFANVLEWPSDSAERIGEHHIGDRIRLDGTIQDGYVHCAEGWISIRCIVTDKPEWANGNWHTVKENTLARNGYDGTDTSWISAGTKVQVLWKSLELSVTNRGTIRTEDLEEETCHICNN